MLYKGILFILIGAFLIIYEKYDIKKIIKDRIFLIKEDFVYDSYYEIKLFLGIFSIIVGIFSIINYIVY
ncbi:hypothetical protein [Caloranaerobacter azorensis]|uniref:Immunity protein 17 n=3 Tax=Caloranaerobacter azorensis TaxID=116090 RepID=A0A1M5WQ91_9FIRM|nr:hypothetical protein [Caloranaerobacter azorensis]KGG79529.1 hypothetical protein Y919_11495 [Caloranaerobacter azorensis H53214]QIB27280.1 V-type ATPase 116kDa subunit family protein [Caloranaerobacter azorensis]SHH89785.1 hypothetical protein SAMN02745135_02594 [Caloranaerobacter azorensis DSM 13643]